MSIATTDTPEMGRWEWVLLIAAVLIQQGAFIPMPSELLGNEAPVDALGNVLDPAESNPLNFAAMLASLVFIGILSIARFRALVTVIKQNPLIVATTLLVIASVAWSYDPALTLRRAGTYSIGVLLALYLASRCSFETVVRLLALSTVLPAVASLIYAVLMPDLAYMQGAEVEGSLRGVYSHKNQLANVLAIGFLLQIYLVQTTPHKARHCLLAALHVLLVVMAHSKASALTLILIAGSLALYRLGRLNRQLAMLATLAGLALIGVTALGAIEDPDGFFALLGRDATLTGRTELWPRMPAIIAQSPWIGWGYSAFWQASNKIVQLLWYQIGWQPPHSHNGFIKVAIDFGVVGLLAAFLLIARFTINAARRIDRGYEAWVYLCMIGYTLFNNIVEITILRGQEFAWFTFLLFYMTAAVRGTVPVPTAEPIAGGILARARPLTAGDRSAAR